MAEIRLARAGDGARVRDVMLAAFEEYRAFALPSSALDESLADVERAVARGGALIVVDGGRDVGSVRFEVPEALRAQVATAWEREREAAPMPKESQTRARDRVHDGALGFARLAVVPDARGRGIGAAIIARLESLAISLALGAVEITVRSQQPDNRPYYERLGYEVTGYGERYGVGDLVTKMRKVLAPR